MPTHKRAPSARTVCVVLAVVCVTLLVFAPAARPAPAALGIPAPCDIPGADIVCDAVGSVAQATADLIMRGVTVWVTNAAVWTAGKVGSLIDTTTSPNVQADWFQNQYAAMLTVAAALALPLLLLALIQAVWRQDVWILLRAACGYLPLAFILAGSAIVATQLLIAITDDLSTMIVSSLGSDSTSLLQSVGDAYSRALDDNSGDAIPLFGIFLGAIILALGAFVLWLEMIIRDAAVYIALFFLPLTFVAMIWPATGRWAKRLVELLVAVVLAKFVIVAIITLATAAITNTTLAGTGEDNVFERMIAGSALLVLAAYSPFALLRMLPMMELAAATVTGNRNTISQAAGSAGIQSPATHMRQAMNRHSSPSPTSSPSSTAAAHVAYANAGGSTAGPSTRRTAAASGATSSGTAATTSAAAIAHPEPTAASMPASEADLGRTDPSSRAQTSAPAPQAAEHLGARPPASDAATPPQPPPPRRSQPQVRGEE